MSKVHARHGINRDATLLGCLKEGGHKQPFLHSAAHVAEALAKIDLGCRCTLIAHGNEFIGQ